jgi:hypothetical protein
LVLLSIPQLLRRRLDGMACAVALAVFAAPVITYWWWIDYVHGVPVNFEIELLRPEQLLWPKVVVMKVIRIALTIGFFTAPVTVGLLITRLFSSGHRPVALRWMTLSIALSLSLFLLTPLHDARLYWGITSVDQNMGNVPPVTGLSQALIPETINRPLLGGLLNLSVSRFDLCVIPLSTLSIVTLAGITLQHLFATVSTGTTRDGIDDSRLALWIRRAIHVLSDGLKIATMSIALLTFLGHFLLILMIWNIFDRYPAPLLSVTLVLLIPMLRQPFGKPDDERGKVVGDVKRRESMRRSAWTLDLLCAAGVLTMATYAIVYTHDYRVMWQSVWDAAGSLQDSGVAADEIELGWAYLGSTIYRRNLAVAFGDEAVTIGDFTFAQRERFFQRVGEVRYFFAISTPNIDSNIKPVHTCKPATWLRTPMLVLYRIPAGEAE